MKNTYQKLEDAYFSKENLDVKEVNISLNDNLQSMLHMVQPIDFHMKSRLSLGQKLTTKHYVVICIEELLNLVNTRNCGLATLNGQIYFFDNEYWRHLSKDEMKNFLGLVAYKLGVEICTSKYHSFKDDLLKQFVSSSFVKVVTNRSVSFVNFQNGTLLINEDGSSTFRNFDKNDYLTFQLPFNYGQSYECPFFLSYLNKVLPDIEQQNIIAEFIAYTFLSSEFLKLEKCLVLFGSGSNGKSVLFSIIVNLLGKENVSNYTLQSLTNESGYQRAMLANRLLNYASEISSKLDSTIFKALVSNEPVECRLPYQEPMIIDNYAKLMFNCNELPKDVEHNNAFYRRFLLIEFGVTITDQEKDPELHKKIISTELPGIFNWVMDGMNRLLVNKKFTDSKKSEQLLKDYQIQSDTVQLFLMDEKYCPCVFGDLLLKNIYQLYRTYCIESGYKPCSNKVFADRLRKIGYILERKSYGIVVNACLEVK